MISRLETFTLLLICLVTVLSVPLMASARTQSRSLGKVEINVTVKDDEQAARPVQHFALLVKKLNNDSPETVGSSIRVKTTSDGSVALLLVAGDYLVESAEPLILDGKAYEWSVKLKVELGGKTSLELNNGDATITPADAALKRGQIVDEADLLSVLRDGVVSVQGELTHGTGFIVDGAGLILTNQHVIAKSNGLRVQFEGGRKLAAQLVAEDPETDLAVLWVNLSACPSCKTLAMAEPEGTKLLTDGARVFTISSPLDQKKTLKAGALVKTEKDLTIADFNLKTSTSGAPLFNTVGDVIGVISFVGQPGIRPEASAVIKIEHARSLLATARQMMKEATGLPSAELLPTEPENSYPVDALKDQLDVKKFKSKPYASDFGKYQFTMITPVLKYYITERNRAELARLQKKNEKSERVATPLVTNAFRDLRNWAEYVNEIRPVVHLLVIPETSATGKSTFLSMLLLGVGAMGGRPLFLPMDYTFKADFKEMSLTCDGKPIIPIQRGKIEFVSELPNYLKTKTQSAYAGIYTYSSETFQPDKCKLLNLEVVSEQSSKMPETKLIEPKMIQKVWNDFELYRQQAGKQ
jgi:S1-C subfamily serine protease